MFSFIDGDGNVLSATSITDVGEINMVSQNEADWLRESSALSRYTSPIIGRFIRGSTVLEHNSIILYKVLRERGETYSSTQGTGF